MSFNVKNVVWKAWSVKMKRKKKNRSQRCLDHSLYGARGVYVQCYENGNESQMSNTLIFFVTKQQQMQMK